MIYSSFHMTQDVAIAILPRIGKIGVPRHFFISTTDSTDRTDELLEPLELLNPLAGSKTKTK